MIFCQLEKHSTNHAYESMQPNYCLYYVYTTVATQTEIMESLSK